MRMACRHSSSVSFLFVVSNIFGVIGQGYIPNPRVEPRCSAYNVLPYDSTIFDFSQPYYVSASSVAGTVIGWNEPDTVVCDSTFTVGAQCCGLCTFIQFTPNNDDPDPDQFSMNMIETAFNECYGGYDTTTSTVYPAYQERDKSVYRVFRSQNYNKWLTSTDVYDRNLIDTPKYRTAPLKYSFGVIMADIDVLVLVFCNNFNNLTYNGAPNVLVLSKSPNLSRDVRNRIYKTLVDNRIDPNSLSFRNNYNCPDIDSYGPNWYQNLNSKRTQPLLRPNAIQY
nr:PREDICTED: uncharacterized protein LOC109042511 [Bemisia tabaci]